MTEKTQKNWTDEKIAQLMAAVGSDQPVSKEAVASAALALNISERSVASKLRNLDIEVASLAKVKATPFTQAQADELAAYVSNNAGVYTYAQIAENCLGGNFTSKQIQGKILSMELTGSVRPSDKVAEVKKYSDEEQAVFVKMATAGKFIEEIAEKLGRTVASIRGKALSLLRSGELDSIPVQKESHAKAGTDGVEALGAKIAEMTVAEIATALGKTERGIKTTLTKRGITVKDYKGADKRLKADEKSVAAA